MVTTRVLPLTLYLWTNGPAYDTVNHIVILSKLYGMTEGADFTKLIGGMISNRRFYIELNGKKSRLRNQKNGLTQWSVLLPVLCNVYTNDQLVHNDTRSFIFADDLCIATQRSTFEQTETILTEAVHNLDKYYKRNHLRANPGKTQTCTFHLKNREASMNLNITWYNKHLEHIPNPVHLRVTVNITLSYIEHIHKLKGKTSARNNIHRKLSNTKWGAKLATIKTTLCYSTAEYACPVWESSPHVSKLGPGLNYITGCLRPTSVENVYILAGIAQTGVRTATPS